ncbi:MAG: FAD-binding oxidoreductase [Deltaproteobacteria bacterium]|nr:FAD-binding oxidoreductase [Deltaproteobacteria bacterium]MBW2415188.1 FAD-binding oxidoreductase [Deltaproteobacteria bacterium]
MDRRNPGAGREQDLVGWGRYPRARGVEVRSEDLESITRGASLCRGLGRAYGDAALPARGAAPLAATPLADRLLAFDPETGVLRAEAGVSLETLNRLLLPRGWFTPVTPGTQFVTLGGMVAADVHGKNHHVAGCFGEHVTALRMRVADGRVLEVTDESEPELFRATLGGMGLTGHVLEVEVRLERVSSPWIWRERTRHPDLASVLEALEAASAEWPMTMAWIDTTSRGRALGRGVVIVGRWAEPDEAPAQPPQPKRRFEVPPLPGLMNRSTIRALNAAYWSVMRPGAGIEHPESFFYPLDMLRHWNRGYGRRGFVQYQVVLPRAGDHAELLERFQRLGGASFVTVLKDCGEAGRGTLSWPKPGTSLALDVPMRGDATQRLVDDLNEFAVERGGRIYLAKDALTRPEHFRAMYPRLDEWQAVRRKWDPEGVLQSAQSQRLLGDAP